MKSNRTNLTTNLTIKQENCLAQIEIQKVEITQQNALLASLTAKHEQQEKEIANLTTMIGNLQVNLEEQKQNYRIQLDEQVT